MERATRIRIGRRPVRITSRKEERAVVELLTSALEPVATVTPEEAPVVVMDLRGRYVRACSGPCPLWTTEEAQALVMTARGAWEWMEENRVWRGLATITDKKIVPAPVRRGS